MTNENDFNSRLPWSKGWIWDFAMCNRCILRTKFQEHSFFNKEERLSHPVSFALCPFPFSMPGTLNQVLEVDQSSWITETNAHVWESGTRSLNKSESLLIYLGNLYNSGQPTWKFLITDKYKPLFCQNTIVKFLLHANASCIPSSVPEIYYRSYSHS